MTTLEFGSGKMWLITLFVRNVFGVCWLTLTLYVIAQLPGRKRLNTDLFIKLTYGQLISILLLTELHGQLIPQTISEKKNRINYRYHINSWAISKSLLEKSCYWKASIPEYYSDIWLCVYKLTVVVCFDLPIFRGRVWMYVSMIT